MELIELVGPHELTGCDMVTNGDANGIVFVLDGITYRAEEDEDDGYRSSLGAFIVVDAPVTNMFPAVRVEGTVSGEILSLSDATTGKPVIEVGTDNADDYYPWFVGRFSPENMTVPGMSKAMRGFGSMDPEKARAIQSKGGTQAQAKGTGRQWTVEEAREAGRKGGLQGAANRQAKRREKNPSAENL